MKITNIFFVIFLTLATIFTKVCSQNVTLKAIAFVYYQVDQLYTPIAEAFNDFSVKHNLNISLSVDLYTLDNSTFHTDDYGSVIETMLKKKKKYIKYDLIFYNNIYSPKFGPYLYDIREILPKEHVDMYDMNVLSQSCSYKDKIVGLPIYIDYEVLYSNVDLLNKYNKPIPETWDELLDTASYILEKEREKNKNTDLVGYNGLVTDDELGFCAINEFIYSFRETKESKYPELKSNATINALKKMKELKEKLSSDVIFKSDLQNTFEMFLAKKAIFLNYFYYKTDPSYNVTALPGVKKGISGSTIIGNNLCMSKNINPQKKEAAIIAFKFLTSKDLQRALVMKSNIFSSIPSIYEEEAVCKIVDCKLFKSIQPIGRPTNVSEDYDSYSDNIRKYFFEYLYGTKSTKYTLQKIEDITKTYEISFDTDDSYIGLIFLYIVSIISFIMVLSLVFLFIPRFKPYFSLLSTDFWFIVIFGLIAIMFSNFSIFGKLDKTKCFLKVFIFYIGFSLILVPILHKLIVNFPDEKQIPGWIGSHKYLFLLIFVFFDLLCLILLSFPAFKVELKNIPDGKNYERCSVKKGVTNMLLIINVIVKFLTLLAILFLIYIEWNIEVTYYDVRFLIPSIYTNFLCLIILMALSYIKIDNYILNFIFPESFCIFISLLNFILLYGIRIIWGFMRKETGESIFIKKVNKNFLDPENVKSSTYESDLYSVSSATEHYINTYNSEYSNPINESNVTSNTNSNIVNTNTNISGMSRRSSSINSYIPNVLIKAYNYHNSKI